MVMNEIEQKGLPRLDELDFSLIQALEKDARSSYHALASEADTSPQTAQRRLTKLVDKGVIRIAVVPDYAVLGYKTFLTLGINTPPGAADEVTKQLASADGVKYLWSTTGRYDVLALAMYRGTKHYLDVFPKEMDGLPENTRIEAMINTKMIKSSWSHLTDHEAVVASHADLTPTELDLSVMKGLGENPRAPVTELAHKIGANVSSVRASLNKLLSRGILQIVGVTDPAAFGYTIRAVTLVQVHPSKLETLTNQLKTNPAVKQIGLLLGAFNCMIWTSFQSSDQMRQFLVHDLGSMPGLVHYETLTLLGGTQKDDVNLVVENQGATNGP